MVLGQSQKRLRPKYFGCPPPKGQLMLKMWVQEQPVVMSPFSLMPTLLCYYTHQVSSGVASTFWGNCGAVRRAVFNAVDGFDDDDRDLVEDIELGYRLKQAGYQIQLCKDIQVKYLKRWELISLLEAEIFYRALPWIKLILRDRHFDADLNLSHTNRASK